MPSFLRHLVAGCAVALTIAVPAARAATVRVAVAANFTAPAQALARIFEQNTGDRALLSFGATGSFYAQIRQGAPFDVLLAADAKRPMLLEDEDAIQPGSRFTYAIGKLALWSARSDLVDANDAVLRGGDFQRLAIANPKLAPYGVAAEEVIAKMGLITQLAPKLVLGESIGQTYNFVATGNADLGFVALSQYIAAGKHGSAWIVPSADYAPIIQQAVVLKRAEHNPAAQAWITLLRSPRGQTLIRGYGYDTPKSEPAH